ncbi:MAG: IPTL-CTERM sorting domain-containing protein [Porticoccaceae bacterium]
MTVLALSGLTSGQAAAEILFTIPENQITTDVDIFLTSGVATTATITNADGSFNTTVPIPANGTAIVTIPSTLRVSPPLGVVSANGFGIDAPDPIAAYLMDANIPVASNDITNLFPDTSLGTNYLAMAATSGIVSDGSQIAVVAGTNATTVTITPAAALSTGQAAGVPFNIVLNRLEAVEFRAISADLTGTLITATQPIAVFGGHKCANVPDTTGACDHVIEQMPASADFGTDFVLVPTEQPGPGDVVKLLARDNGTVVTFEDSGGATVQPTLAAGQSLTLPPGLTENTRVTSNNPILIGQFMLGAGLAGAGDPAFALVPDRNQWLDRYIFNVPVGDYNDFLGIAIEGSALASLTLDGVPVNPSSFGSVPGTTLMAGNIPVTDGSHVIEASTDFMLLGHGFNNNAASYFGVGGSSISGGGVTPPPPPPPPAPHPNAIPTLSPWALAVLAGLIGVLAAAGLRSRQRA